MSGAHLQKTRSEERYELFEIGKGLGFELEQMSNIVQNDMGRMFKGKEAAAMDQFKTRINEFLEKVNSWSIGVAEFYTNQENNDGA